MPRAILFILLVVPFVAIPHAQSTPLTMDGYPGMAEPASVKLLSPGAAPRTKLRFGVPSTYADRFEMTMRMSMTMDMGGGVSMPTMHMPPITTSGNVAVTEVAPNGDISYEMLFSGLSVPPDADPIIVAGIQRADQQFKSAKASATMTDRGVVYKVTTGLGSIDPQLRQFVDQVSNQAQSFSTPLPEEELGVGARWEVRQALSTVGMQLFQRVEYELVTFEDQTVTLTMKVEQTAPAQTMSTPALPMAGDVRLMGHAAVGTGKMIIHLDQLVPTSTLDMDSRSKMEMSIGGTTQTMSSKMSLNVNITHTK